MMTMTRPAQEVYLPSLEEIRQSCLEIQESWSPAERDRRQVGRREMSLYSTIMTCHLSEEDMEYAA